MKAINKVAGWARKIVKRSKMALNRIESAIFRTITRINRNRPVNKGLFWKIGSFELNIYPRHDRPKLYIQRYGRKGN